LLPPLLFFLPSSLPPPPQTAGPPPWIVFTSRRSRDTTTADLLFSANSRRPSLASATRYRRRRSRPLLVHAPPSTSRSPLFSELEPPRTGGRNPCSSADGTNITAGLLLCSPSRVVWGLAVMSPMDACGVMLMVGLVVIVVGCGCVADDEQ
ncbi:hypothetical protein Tsubulata_028505, partial [Turnera subulata]